MELAGRVIAVLEARSGLAKTTGNHSLILPLKGKGVITCIPNYLLQQNYNLSFRSLRFPIRRYCGDRLVIQR